jgi:4-amino-4-deoxy-L-arabinose transferase-like glycosyltransferase
MLSREMRPLSILLVTGLAAGVILWVTMYYGPGVQPDSVTYLLAASSVSAGKGLLTYNVPMTHFPPFYSIILSAFGLLPGDQIQNARLLQSVLFGLNVVLFGYAIYTASRRNVWAAGIGVVLFAASKSVMVTHMSVLSEGLFIFCMLLSFIFLSGYLKKGKYILLILAGLFVGLTIMTRYAGLALIPAMVLMLLLSPDRPFKSRLTSAVGIVFLAALPLGLWMLRNLFLAGTATNRQLAFHPFGIQHLKSFIYALSQFLFPVELPNVIRVLYVLLFLALVLLLAWFFLRDNQYRPAAHSSLIFVNLLFAACYMIFLVLSISFFDAATPMSHRILLPLYTVLTLAFIALSATQLTGSGQQFVMAIALLLVPVRMVDAVQASLHMYRYGQGYQSSSWIHSESIAYVRSLPEDVRILTNGKDAIVHLTGRFTENLPSQYDSKTLQILDNYEQRMLEVCHDVQNGQAVIAYFSAINRRYLPTSEELEGNCAGLTVIRLMDGVIFSGHD